MHRASTLATPSDRDGFKVFQATLAEIEGRCGLTFDPAITAVDTFAARAATRPAQDRAPLASLADIDWT